MFFSSLRLYVDPFVGLLIYFSATVCVNIFLQLFVYIIFLRPAHLEKMQRVLICTVTAKFGSITYFILYKTYFPVVLSGFLCCDKKHFVTFHRQVLHQIPVLI